MTLRDEILSACAGRIKDTLEKTDKHTFENAEEIRIRSGRGMFIKTNLDELAVCEDGSLTREEKNIFIPTEKDIHTFFEVMSGYSFYAFNEEIKNGFITIQGGHRIGIAGHAVCENGKITALSDISSVNIRICRQMIGISKKVIPYIYKKGTFLNTVIISPPGFGKTTLLRDIIRNLSVSGQNVSVADERGEIGGCWKGHVTNDLGPRTDVMDSVPKALGMRMLLRSMAPDVIACDEAGGEDDIMAIDEIKRCGVKILCTFHGYGIKDLEIKTGSNFERYIVLDFADGIRKAAIFDENKMIGVEKL
jgi:stage III sporulation protein AA